MAQETQTPELIPPPPAIVQEGQVVPSDAALLPGVTADAPPPPLGRTWLFDLRRDEFVRIGARGPRQIRGAETLAQWIDKALHSERGALPIHPPGYGMQEPQEIFGRNVAELSVQELHRRIEDALTFHPRIAAVVDVKLRIEDDQAFCTFKVQTDPPLDEAELLLLRLDLGAF